MLKLDFFKFKEDNPYEGINLLESFASESHITFCQSMEDYMTVKRLSKRVAIVLLLNLLVWILVIKSIIMGLTKDKLFASYTGHFTYLYPRTDIMNFIIVIIYSGISLAVSFTVFLNINLH